jgi:hypothetical protein
LIEDWSKFVGRVAFKRLSSGLTAAWACYSCGPMARRMDTEPGGGDIELALLSRQKDPRLVYDQEDCAQLKWMCS